MCCPFSIRPTELFHLHPQPNGLLPLLRRFELRPGLDGLGRLSNMVTDEDLDRHVAELILKEAKTKAERYGTQGIRAFLPGGGQCVSYPHLCNTAC